MKDLLKRRAWVPAAVAAVLAGVLTRLILRNGIFTTPDSWAYWEGSISLLQNQRYEWFGGETLYLWPPLYSIYLAICQWIAGPSGVGLIWASTLLAAASCFTWCLYALRLTQQSNLTPQAKVGVGLLACVFICFFVPATTFKLLAQTLSIGLTGLIYWLIIREPSGSSARAYRVHCIVLGCVQALALLTHNAIIAILPGIALALFTYDSYSIRTRLSGIVLNVGISVAPWLAVRIALQQGGSHPVGAGDQFFPVVAYLHQSALTLGQFFFSNANEHRTLSLILGVGFIVTSLVTWQMTRVTDRSAWRSMLLTILSYLSLLALFCWTPVYNPISSRFLWAVPLGVVPVLFVMAHRQAAWLTIALAVLVCTFPAKRTVQFAVRGRLQEQTYSNEYQSSFIIYPRYVLTTKSDPVSKPTWYHVRPPTYPWQKRYRDVNPADRPKWVKLRAGSQGEDSRRQGP